MVRKTEVPGKGLPWPDSIRAVISAYGTLQKASRRLGVSVSALGTWARDEKHPSPAIRKRLAAFWRSDDELPDPSQVPKYAGGDCWGAWTPADYARLAMFRARYRAAGEFDTDPTVRFARAIIESAVDIKRPDLLEKWVAMKDATKGG